MTRPTGRTLTLVLGTGPDDGATVAALQLAEQAIGRGHRVAVYAYGDGVRTSAAGSTSAAHVAALLRQGLHGGLLSWVADQGDLADGAAQNQVPGVLPGDGGDLWRFVRDGDVVLGVGR
ncbi:MAG: hypothetical protein M3N57_09095 [Actinomycetota bacterium]|nr:hypothetical protein [Actinomycetota bacterium]